MDDSVPQPVAVSEPVVQSVPPVQPIATPQSFIPGGKEHEPIPVVTQPVEAPLQVSEPELKLSPEVKEAGVEVVSEFPVITDEQKAVGVEHAPGTMPAQTEPQGTVQLPLTTEDAMVGRKNGTSSSFRWLAESVIRQIKMMHQKFLQ